MADAPAEGGKKKSGGGGIVGLLVVTLLAAGGGAGFAVFLQKQMSADASKKTPEPPKEEAASKEPSLIKLVQLNPLVANLAEPQDAWVRIEASVVIDGMKEGAEALANKVGEDIVAYLKTTKLNQFEGASGFQNIREDILDRAKIRDAEHVKDVIVHGIVME